MIVFAVLLLALAVLVGSARWAWIVYFEPHRIDTGVASARGVARRAVARVGGR